VYAPRERVRAVLSKNLRPMEVDDFTAHRQQAERLLQLAREKVSDAERERIFFAVQNRRAPDQVERLLSGTAAEDLGARLVFAVNEAEARLKPKQACEIERLILDDLRPPTSPRPLSGPAH